MQFSYCKSAKVENVKIRQKSVKLHFINSAKLKKTTKKRSEADTNDAKKKVPN